MLRKKPRKNATAYKNSKHEQARVNYAKANINKLERFWQKFLRLGEIQLELFGKNDRQYVWQAPNTAFEKNVVPIVKIWRHSIMIWECFAAAGKAQIVRIDGTMNIER